MRKKAEGEGAIYSRDSRGARERKNSGERLRRSRALADGQKMSATPHSTTCSIKGLSSIGFGLNRRNLTERDGTAHGCSPAAESTPFDPGPRRRFCDDHRGEDSHAEHSGGLGGAGSRRLRLSSSDYRGGRCWRRCARRRRRDGSAPTPASSQRRERREDKEEEQLARGHGRHW